MIPEAQQRAKDLAGTATVLGFALAAALSAKPLRDELSGLRSARRGDYRVLFSLDHERGVLLVIRLAHRADAYRPR